MRRVVIMGAGGRDFHDFNTAFRDDPDVEVVAFTATQIPFIDDRRYPAALAGARYPDGIPIVAEEHLARLVAEHTVDEVVFSYSDVAHDHVMRRASIALATGAGFRLLGPRETTLTSAVPVIAICATRTGAGKSQTSRRVAELVLETGHRVGLVRHPMPYGDLERMRVQRFASQADIDAADPTIEEREEYELPVATGVTVYAGVDYGEVLRLAERECDVLVWDGGNNDVPFVWPDLHLTVTDALRPGQELGYHPGEVNLRRADAVVVNKIDAADERALARVLGNLARANPAAPVIRAESIVTVDPGPSLEGARVLVVEDGPTITHGGMPFGAGAVAARQVGARLVDPRSAAVGSLADTFAAFPHVGPVLPAMGYSQDQLHDLAATIDATECDAVLVGTPVDLARVVELRRPVRRVRYELGEVGEPGLRDVVAPRMERWHEGARTGAAAHHVPRTG